MSNLPVAQQGAWLSLAEAKNNLAADLTNRELALQGIIMNVPDEKITPSMAAYKKGHEELVAERMKFTNLIRDKLIEPLMVVEKRTDPKTNAAFILLASRELELRKKATADLVQQQNIATEKAQFKAHFQNEYMGIGSAYRNSLRDIIHQCYMDCLTAKTPPDQVDSAIAVARLAITDVKIGQPNKFTRVHLSTEDAAALYKQLPPFNKSAIFEEMQAELTEKFSMYANDLANAEVAAENNERSFQATVVEEIQELRTEQAANVLMASAESFILPEAGFKAVTSTQRIKIEDNSESWVIKIMSAFLANFAVAFNKTRNKKYSSLTVAQMAAALDQAGVRVEGVQYTTVEK